MLRSRSLLFAASALLGACNCGDKGETTADDGKAAAAATPQPTSVPSDDAVLEAVKSLGNEGAAVLVVRPGQWKPLHEALAPWLERLPAEAKPLQQLKEGKDLPQLLGLWLGMGPGAMKLAGWDPERPVVASVGEVPYDGVPGAVTPALPVRDGWLPPMRSQVLVPATDANTLAGSLATLLSAGAEPWPALVEGRAGAQALRIGSDAVALLPEDSAVRVVIFNEWVIADEAKLLEHLRGRLDAQAAEPPPTPALSLLAQPDAVMAGWVRPWRMRPLGAWSGAVQVLRALEVVSPDQRAVMFVRGMQIVLDSELVMTDTGAEFDDLAMTLTVDQGVVRVRSASSLTPEGKAIFDAAGDASIAAAASNDALVDLVVRADVRAMLEATQPPPAFARMRSPFQMAERIQEGGSFATLTVALRHPLGLVRALEGMAKGESVPISLDTLPTGAHVVWRGMDGAAPRVAMAVHWPKGYADGPLKTLAGAAKADRELSSLSTSSTEHDGRPVTVFGLGGESMAAFDPAKSVPGEALLQLRVSPSKMGPTLSTMGLDAPELMAVLAGMGDVLVTWEHQDQALVGELAWSPTGGEVKPEIVPINRGTRWDSPLGSTFSAGGECLAEAGRRLSRGLEAMASIAPDQRITVIAKSVSEAGESLACAAENETTAAAAAQLRVMAVTLMADALVEFHDYAGAKTLLTQQCRSSGNDDLCAQQRAFDAMPQPSLPTVERNPDCEPPYDTGGDFALRLDAKGLALDGAMVTPAELGTRLTAAIEKLGARDTLRPPPESDGGPRYSASLAVDEATTMASLRPLLEILLAQKVTDVAIRIGPSGMLRARLEAKASIPGETAATPTPASPTPPEPPTKRGLYEMMPPEGAVGNPFLPSDWALLDVGKGTVTARTFVQREPEAHAAPSASTLRDAVGVAQTVYVRGHDDATWKELAAAMATGCDHVTLALDAPTP